ncbi:hypothetical protein NFI96_029120 [Prochilodus magdalenae]|nr:hypothetical protein NFI96_029120 [Prochilodus magdalenae]
MGPVLLTVGISAFLVLMITIAARWMWRRRSRSAEGHRTTVESEQDDSEPVYSNISALALTPDPTWRASDDQINVLYYNVPFKRHHSQETPAHQANLTNHTSESLHYAVVNFHRPAGATQSLPADAPSQIYSQIQKRKPVSGEKNTQRHRGAQWVFRAEGPGAPESEEHHRDQRLWVNC